MPQFVCLTRWFDGAGASFDRTHVREAPDEDTARDVERAHNQQRLDEVPSFRQEGWQPVIVNVYRQEPE